MNEISFLSKRHLKHFHLENASVMEGIIISQSDFSLNNHLPELVLVVTKSLVHFSLQSIFLVQDRWTFEH